MCSDTLEELTGRVRRRRLGGLNGGKLSARICGTMWKTKAINVP